MAIKATEIVTKWTDSKGDTVTGTLKAGIEAGYLTITAGDENDVQAWTDVLSTDDDHVVTERTPGGDYGSTKNTSVN